MKINNILASTVDRYGIWSIFPNLYKKLWYLSKRYYHISSKVIVSMNAQILSGSSETHTMSRVQVN